MSHPLRSWKNLGWQLVGVAPDSARHTARRALGRVTMIGEAALEDHLARAAELFAESDDKGRAFVTSFQLKAPDMPEDPFSPAYADAQSALYERIAGRGGYEVANEASDVDLDAALAAPYPYGTGSPQQVSEQLLAWGFIIKALNPQPGWRAVEFGPGWGNLTLHLTTMGVDVTAVEVDGSFAELIRRRTSRPDKIHIQQSDMLSFVADGRYDAAIFFESFHHCSRHRDMLDHLRDVVTDDGVIAFAGEPVGWMPYPWGLRLDGMSLWSVRRYGWLELGFSRSYFTEALRRAGWRGERVSNRSLGHLADVTLVRRA